MAVSRGRPQVFMLYQRGRGQEPVTVAGSKTSFVAVNAITLFLSQIEQTTFMPPAEQHKTGADGFGGVIKVYHHAKGTSGFFGACLPVFTTILPFAPDRA
jgi:hypothetical protein